MAQIALNISFGVTLIVIIMIERAVVERMMVGLCLGLHIVGN
ncbi:MAG: hypothetical protein ACTTGW_01525 [Candidatus Cryptobacteroides sp.]